MANEPLCKLGRFKFTLNSALPEQMDILANYRWVEQDRIGRQPALQFTGEGCHKIMIKGSIFPGQKIGDVAAMEELRKQATTGKPLKFLIVDNGQQRKLGLATMLGRWVIESINETRRVFLSNGAPRKIEFDLSLKRYGEDKRK